MEIPIMSNPAPVPPIAAVQSALLPEGLLPNAIPPPLMRGARLRITPLDPELRTQCSDWIATAVSDVQKSTISVRFDNQNCPPSISQSGTLIVYWLRAESVPGTTTMHTRWRLYPALSTMQSILPDKSLALASVHIQNAKGDFIPLDSARFVQPVLPVRRGDTRVRQLDASLPVSLRTILSERDMQARRKAIQDVLLHKHKPRLVRSVNGGRNNGLGIRDLTDTEFRKEWLQFKEDMYLNVNITVTDNDSVPITDVTIHGKILSRNDVSPTLNNLGVLYELDPDNVHGTPYDTETYTPLYIGRRKLRYWVGVYYDLKDNKVILTADTVKYAEMVESLSPGGKGEVRLAEYLVTDIKLSNKETTEVPYPGDYEDKEYKDLLASANRIESEAIQVPETEPIPQATKVSIIPPSETGPDSSVLEPQKRLAETVTPATDNNSSGATTAASDSVIAVGETETTVAAPPPDAGERLDEDTFEGAYKGAQRRVRAKKQRTRKIE